MTAKDARKLRAQPPQGTSLLLETHVAGVKYHRFADGRMPIDEGMLVELVREPKNKYDADAIAIRTPRGAKLGYVPRRKNSIPARLIDAGWTLVGRIERVDTPHADLGRRDPTCRRAAIRVSVFVPRLH
jgi:hypothetical protein